MGRRGQNPSLLGPLLNHELCRYTWARRRQRKHGCWFMPQERLGIESAKRPPAQHTGDGSPRVADHGAREVPLGTARWMTTEEATSKFGFDDQHFALNADGLWEGRSNGQIWIGEAPDGVQSPLGYADDRHVCLVAGPRSGKGAGIIVPNLCLWPGSCIVIDPKGENATITAQRRGPGSDYAYGMGQAVHILDPYGEVNLDPSLKSRFNPLDAIDPAGPFAVADVGRIAASLVVVENQHDPFWEQSAQRLVKCLILYVLTEPNFEGRRNLVSVWRLLNQGDWLTVEVLRAHGEKKIPSAFDLLWEGMKRNEAFNGLVSGQGQQMMDMADKTRDGVLKAAVTNFAFLDDAPMQSVLEASDFDLAALKTDPKGISIYLTLPQRYMPTHFRWLRLMIEMAVGEMERLKGPPATGFPTLFLLDEFAGLKRMEVVEHAAAQAAGFGVKFFFVLQNLPQIKLHYKESWETFLGTSGLKLFFHIEDEFTRSYLTRQLGEHETTRITQSGSNSRSSGTTATDGTSSSVTGGSSRSDGHSNKWYGPTGSTSGWTQSTSAAETSSNSTAVSQSQSVTKGWGETVHKRSLLHPDEIGRAFARIDDVEHSAYPGIVLALIPGEHAMLSRRVNYFESMRFAGMFDPHPNYPPPPNLAQRIAERQLPRLTDERPKPTTEERIDKPRFTLGRFRYVAWGILFLGLFGLLAYLITTPMDKFLELFRFGR